MAGNLTVMRLLLISLTVASVLATSRDIGGASYSIGLWGDLPYGDTQALIGVPNLIKDMNNANLAFTVHDGDFKEGNAKPNSTTPTDCSNALYQQQLGFFNSLEAPSMYTPGDNEWTDCDRPANGAFNSRERLNYIRKTFFSNDFSLGKKKLKQTVQKDQLCLDENNNKVACVENRRWSYKKVMYITLNVQGSCNNLCDVNPDQDEWAARNAANIKWLKDSFAAAKMSNAPAIMIITQADPGWDLTDGTRTILRDPKNLTEVDGQPDGFFEYLTTLRDEVVKFGKPVAYVHGDSHYFRVDQPLRDANGVRIVKFTRVETPGDNSVNGDNDVNWVKVTVTPNSREVFSYQLQLVPGNN